MLFCCKSANDSQEVNKTLLVLLGRVKTMKKGKYLSIFSKQTSASCFQALTIENIALIAAILRHFLSRRAWSPGRWLGMANFKINSHLCRLLTILLSWCQLKSFHFLMMFFCDIEENTKEKRWRKIISDLIFLQTFDPEEGVLRSSIQYTPKVGRFEKIKECPKNLLDTWRWSTKGGRLPAATNKLARWTFFKWIISFVFVVSW